MRTMMITLEELGEVILKKSSFKSVVLATDFSFICLPGNTFGKGRFIKVKKPGAENTEDDDKPGLPQQGI